MSQHRFQFFYDDINERPATPSASFIGFCTILQDLIRLKEKSGGSFLICGYHLRINSAIIFHITRDGEIVWEIK